MDKPRSVPWLGDEGSQPKRVAPAASRNRQPITEVLRGHLPASGTVLEVASGSGEHIVHFARTFPALTWVPSDPDPEARESIAAYAKEADVPNLQSPLVLDVQGVAWPVLSVDAVLCINMIHISAWEATVALAEGSARILPKGGLLYLYGPYRRQGVVTAESNEAFDRSLRSRNPDWGLRSLEDVIAVFARFSLEFSQFTEMPANNLSVMFRRS